MKKIINKTFQLEDPIYHSDVMVIIGEYAFFKKALSKRGVDVGINNKDFYAEFGEIKNTNDELTGYYVRIPVIDFTNLNYCSIVHELTHLTYHVLDRAGVKHDIDNHESFTYLLEMFLSDFLHKSMKLYKNT